MRLLADLVVVAHIAFVLFVVIGGLLVVKWPRLAWIHVPAAAWGAAVELAGRVCPLTPLEQLLRGRAGAAAYEGDFIARYLLPVLYPEGLTREVQLALGTAVIVINGAFYVAAFRKRSARVTDGASGSP